MDRVVAARRAFAEELRFVEHIGSAAVINAFATVPRERFLGPTPWYVLRFGAEDYWRLPDDDPVHAYHNVLFAIDRERGLNNGQPEFWARLLDSAAIRPGDTVFHIGAGTGYYTAILAELTGPDGRVIAAEIDPGLAKRAAVNLADRPNVQIVTGDGAVHEPGAVDALVVNAGVTHPKDTWLAALKPGGRMLVPMTTDRGDGTVFRIERLGSECRFAAKAVSGVHIYPCAGARKPEEERMLVRSLGDGGQKFVRSLRCDRHGKGETCWFHGDRFCLSAELP
jgi:protein-L-isoaspartate(D-aspartate) O-methyltransferase